MNLSGNSQADPKEDFLNVMFSFVCESNVGFSISVFANIQRCDFT